MSKLLYLQVQAVGLLQLRPSDLGAFLSFNGINTSLLKYGAVISSNHDPGDTPQVPFDYVQYQIVSATLTPQNTSQTSQIATETGPLTYPIWQTIVVPDNFVLPTPADLTVTLKSVSPASFGPTTPLKITLAVENKGTTAADVSIGIYVSDDPTITTSDRLVLAAGLGMLDGKDAFDPITWTGTPNDFGQPISGGKHYIGAIVDYKNNVAESNEGNNVSKAIAITSATPAADLKVALKSVAPTTVASDGKLDVHYTISNVGNANAGASELTFYLSKDATIDKDDLKLSWGDTLDLAAGKSFDSSFDHLGLFDIFPAGKYYVGAIIDSDGRITESNETNNASKGIPITITGENLPPVAGALKVTTPYEQAVDIDILEVASDPNPGDKISFEVLLDEFHQPDHGQVELNSDGTITYTPDPGFVGKDQIVYSLTDNHGLDSKDNGFISVLVEWQDVVKDLGNLTARKFVFRDFDMPQAAGPDGTYTFHFEITKPTTLDARIHGGPQFQAELFAQPGNKAPTLGPGPDRISSADKGFPARWDDPDDPEEPKIPQIIQDPVMPGKYSLQITRNPGEVDGFEHIFEGEIEFELSPDEAGNRIEWATAIKTGATTKGMVNVIDNKDIFKFTLTQQSSVLVSLAAEGMAIKQDGVPPIHYEIMTNAGSTDFYHVLESHTDASSRWVDSSYTAPVLDDVANTPLDPGDYYVIVYHPADITQPPVTTQDIKYSLWVNAWVDNAANRMLVEDFGAEGPKSAHIGDLTGKSYKNRDFLGLADQNDFYVFTLSERSTVKITLAQSSAVSMDLDFSGLAELEDPEALVDAVGDGGGPRTIIATLDAGLYSLRAYTDTDFHDPAGTSKYGTALLLPYGGGAFYDLNISSTKVASGKALQVGTANDDNYLGSTGDDKLFSGGGNDKLFGGGGSDNLNGGPGNDIVQGGAGPDNLAGGGGNDTLSYARDLSGVSITLVAGKVPTIVVQGGDAEGDLATGFSNVIGGAGPDILTGDSGNNALEGGKGGDILTGGDGFDIVSYASSVGAVTVDLASQSASGGDAQGDTISGFEGAFGGLGNDRLTGDGKDNLLVGNAGDDMLSGGGGNDGLKGSAGNDTIEGGAGADAMDGGSGIDTLSYANSPSGLNNAGVVIDLSKKTATGNDAAGDKISNFENVAGSAGNDLLTGDKSSNVIMGGAGNDTITGGAGIDTLTGGVGDDVFRFLAPADGGDDITDFNSSGVDKISIVKSAFGMAAANLANFTSSQYFEQGVGHAPTAKHAQFLFDTATDELWFDSDGTGLKAAAVLIATFTDGATLDASDFELK